MSEFHILFIDDDPDYVSMFESYCEDLPFEGSAIRVTTTHSFDMGEQLLTEGRFDALVVDLHEEGGDAYRGERVLELVQRKQFVPVVIHTGHAEHVAHLESDQAFVGVVKKTDGFKEVFRKLSTLHNKPAHAMRRALRAMLDEMEAMFLWGFVQRHTDVLEGAGKEHMLAQLLADRLSVFLQAEGGRLLLARMNVSGGVVPSYRVHPITCYVIPTIGDHVRTCELLKRQSDGVISLVLTPECDLVLQSDGTRRARSVLLVGARSLSAGGIAAYEKFCQSPETSENKKRLAGFLSNTSIPEQNYFLPGIDEVPDLVLDFQATNVIRYDELGGYTRIAALAAPFAQEVRNRFARWVGRVGTPNLDTDYLMDRIKTRIGG